MSPIVLKCSTLAESDQFVHSVHSYCRMNMIQIRLCNRQARGMQETKNRPQRAAGWFHVFEENGMSAHEDFLSDA